MSMQTNKQPSPVRLVPVCAALTLLLLWAAELTGYFALLFFFPIALLMLPLCAERLWGWTIVCDLLIAAFVLILPVPHYAWLAFVCVLAPYVPLRHALRRIGDPRRATVLAVGLTLVWTALLIFVLSLLGVGLLTVLPPFATVLTGLAVLAFLFLLDAAYQFCLNRLQKPLRRFLLPRA
ncbi:MAG: hypothetical protein II872_05220 [Clostridia bacterium]|nr:hypothetical protein [Clostridia bacterium]